MVTNFDSDISDQRWTRTHGFFASMGGFMLYDGNEKMIQTLSIEMLEALASQGKIRWPRISVDEIMDRSKRDVFSKGVAVLQTTWFITQCIARAVYGLTITELELATLAFAVLNGLLSFLWWNKPQDVACPAPVYLCHPSSESKREAGTQTTDPEYEENPEHDLSSIHSDSSCMTKVSGDEDLSSEKNDQLLAKKLESTSLELHTSVFARYTRRLEDMAWFLFCIFWQPVLLMATCNTITDSRPLSVPTFYAPYTDPLNDDSKVDTSLFHNSESLSAMIAIIVGILFGGIHCIAWSFTFLSVAEGNIWTTSSVFITVVPFAWGSIEVLAIPFRLIIKSIKRWYDPDSQSVVGECSRSSFYLRKFHECTGMITFLGYFASRVALLILPLIALRSLSPDSLLDINWSSYIPHV
jgi:hypothetical protein